MDQLKHFPNNEISDYLLAVLDNNSEKFEKNLSRLKLFSQRCQGNDEHSFITHGDVGGNILVNHDCIFLADWDDPVITPPERDAWFSCPHELAMKEFNKALHKNGIDYSLKPDRLAYYCYHSFFWYLTKYITRFLESTDENKNTVLTEIVDYILNSWVNNNVKYADDNF